MLFVNMPGLPKITKFRGDNEQSFKTWILQFEAQVKALGHEDTKWRELLLCSTEGKAFNTLINSIQADGEITYADCKTALQEQFSGPDYKEH